MTTKLFTIPPLEWEWFETNSKRGYRVLNELFSAEVFQIRVESGWEPWARWVTSQTKVAFCPSPEAGKELAEAHWREYVKRELEPAASQCYWCKHGLSGDYPCGCTFSSPDPATPTADSIRAAAEEIANTLDSVVMYAGVETRQQKIVNHIVEVISRHLGAHTGDTK